MSMLQIPKISIKPVILWLSLIAGNVVVLTVLILPAVQQSNALASSISDEQAAIDKQAGYYAQLAILVSKVKVHQSDLQKISGSWDESSTSLSSLIYFLQQQAKASGLTVSSIGFANGSLPAANPNGGSQKVTISAQMSGSYQSLKAFLEKVETVIPLLEVTDLSFSVPGVSQAGALENYQFSLTIQAQ